MIEKLSREQKGIVLATIGLLLRTTAGFVACAGEHVRQERRL